MKMVAVTACPTGIAHTYMAAEALIKSAVSFGIQIQVETQGAMGIENQLTHQDIHQADLILIASDINIENAERFQQYQVINTTIVEVLTDPNKVIQDCIKQTS